MKRLFSLLLTLSLLLGAVFPVASAEATAGTSQELSLSAQSAVLIHAEDGEVYYAKNADTPMGMASTTKLMTALVVAEHCDPQKSITVPQAAVGIEGSSIYLTKGEMLTVEELLYALLLASANDAATALALTVSDSVADFCALMNQKAKELGLSKTHFVNPHGLHHEDHYTTARELAIIAAAVLKVPLLRKIVATKKATISHDGKADQRLLVNHNRLLSSYEGAIGMKTGYTKKTGRTLVSAAERQGLTLIAVTLNAPDDWRDHATLLDYGFANYETVTLAEIGSFRYAMPVTGGQDEQVWLTNEQALRLTLPKKREKITYRIFSASRFLFAPQDEGNRVATLTYYCGGKTVSSPLCTLTAVSQTQKKKG